MIVFTGLVNIGHIVATCICKEILIWSKNCLGIGDLSDKNQKIQPRLQSPAPAKYEWKSDLGRSISHLYYI